MTDQSVVSEFLRLAPDDDGLFRNKDGLTAQPWSATTSVTVNKFGKVQDYIAAFFEKGMDAPRAEYLICLHNDKVIGVCCTEDLRNKFIKRGEQWLLPHLMPPYAAFMTWHGCEACGDPRASMCIGFDTKAGVMGTAWCSKHAPIGGEAWQ